MALLRFFAPQRLAPAPTPAPEPEPPAPPAGSAAARARELEAALVAVAYQKQSTIAALREQIAEAERTERAERARLEAEAREASEKIERAIRAELASALDPLVAKFTKEPSYKTAAAIGEAFRPLAERHRADIGHSLGARPLSLALAAALIAKHPGAAARLSRDEPWCAPSPVQGAEERVMTELTAGNTPGIYLALIALDAAVTEAAQTAPGGHRTSIPDAADEHACERFRVLRCGTLREQAAFRAGEREAEHQRQVRETEEHMARLSALVEADQRRPLRSKDDRRAEFDSDATPTASVALPSAAAGASGG